MTSSLAALASGSVTSGGMPCESETQRAQAAAVGNAAERVYGSELTGAETIADERQVEAYRPLLAAVAKHKHSAIVAAVKALVYSHTHIVRLRVSRKGVLLDDIGGPYIIAPVAGTLHYRGRTVGTYLLSVQDDLGYVGLEKRLIGMPLELDLNGERVPIPGTVDTGLKALPSRGAVTLEDIDFQVYSFNAKAYPTGVLRISILVPPVRASRRSCVAVRVAELGRIGRRIWNRFLIDRSPVGGFVAFAQEHTGSLFYVRAGSKQIAGSTRPGPPRLPNGGSVRYQGQLYDVTSFASGRLRVYQLVPVPVPVFATGPEL